jgi:hypothetical protein
MTRPLEIVHTDLVGPTTTKGLKGGKYFMLLVDDYTRMTAVFFLRNKSEDFENFKVYVRYPKQSKNRPKQSPGSQDIEVLKSTNFQDFFRRRRGEFFYFCSIWRLNLPK